ncbi:MAG TPA: antibiotic biosynthesis monooxygenase [Actinomycetota bacterium]
MHALVAGVAVQSGHEEEALEHLKTNVVPRVKEAPGVVAGFWLASQDGHGLAFIVWESEDAAQRGAEMARNAPRPESVTFDSIEVREVVAQV